MKDTKIVLVAEWEGWCAPCAVERPLALTRSGRLGLRTWLTAPVSESRPLTLTCRLCGNSDVVPPEEDDPPVLVTSDEAPTPVPAPAAAVGSTVVTSALLPVPDHPTAAPALPVPAVVSPVLRSPELDRARGSLGAALGALLAERTAQGRALAPVVPHVPALAAHAVPLQRTASSDADGLTTLELLADGLDLLRSGRS